jgi:hypothetical protein
MSDDRKEVEGSLPSDEPRQEREGEPGNALPFGPERHGTASMLPPAYEQGRQAYVAALSANDIQRRRVTAAALAGASSVIVPPQQPPQNPQPVLSSGVVVPVGISLGGLGQTVTVDPVPTPIHDWPPVRAEMLSRLETVEAGFRKIAPFLAALETAYGERGKLGDNYPPERIEMLPLDTIEIQMGTEVAKLARAELNTENPRRDVLRVSGLVLNQIAARTSACLSWIAAKGNDFVDACVKSAGDQTGKLLVTAVVANQVLQQLHIDLTAIVTEILHLVTH